MLRVNSSKAIMPRQINNRYIAFRCSNRLTDALQAYALDHDLHVSQVIRQAIDTFLFDGEKGKIAEDKNLGFFSFKGWKR